MTPEEIALIKNPSTERWLAEFEQMLRGERDEAYLHQGGPGGHARTLIRLSEERAHIRPTFVAAVQLFISAWSVEERTPPAAAAAYIALIQQTKPPIGFAKIVAFLDRWGFFESIDSPYRKYEIIDIHLRALTTLALYMPAAMPALEGQHPLYVEDFKRVMVKQFADMRYAGYALGFVLMSGVASTRSPELRDIPCSLATAEDTPALEEAIATLTRHESHRLFPSALVDFYETLLEDDKGSTFWETLGRLGATMPSCDDTDLQLPSGTRVHLDFSRRSSLFTHIRLVTSMKALPKWQGLPLGNENVLSLG